MKILHVETGRHMYGGALQVDYLMRGLAERGCQNVLVCARGAALAATRHAEQVCPVPARGDLDARLAASVWRAARRHRVDVVHVHCRRGADLWGGLGARWAGVPALLTRRVDNPESRLAARYKYLLYARIVVISTAVCEALVQAGVAPARTARVTSAVDTRVLTPRVADAGRRPPGLTCIPDAVDTEVFVPSANGDTLRAEFGLASDALVAGVAAQMIERKGHRDIIAALPAVLKRHPNLRVLFFGQGPLRATLEQEVAAAGLTAVIRFAGFREDLASVLPQLDMLVHPARREGLGVAVLQASACAVPVVAARAGGVPEVVRDGISGYLFAPGDTAALASTLAAACADPAARKLAGARGRQIVERAFSIDRMASDYARIYAGIVDRCA